MAMILALSLILILQVGRKMQWELPFSNITGTWMFGKFIPVIYKLRSYDYWEYRNIYIVQKCVM